MVIELKIVGHELVTVTEGKGHDKHEYEMLKVKFKGLGTDKKSQAVILFDPEQMKDYPLGEKGEMSFEIRQQRMELGDGKRAPRAAKEHRHELERD